MIAALLLATVVASNPAPPSLAHWKYERIVDTGVRGGTESVAVPPSIYADAQPSLDDLRVVDGRGNLVPFALRTPQPGPTVVWTSAALTDEGLVPGQYSQVVADLGPNGGVYGILDISTPLRAFATTVDVDASDDRKIWRTIRTGAPIYDYERDGLAANTRVRFPRSTARYLRVRILDPNAAFPIDGVRVAAPAGSKSENTRYTMGVVPTNRDVSDRATSYRVDGIDEVPIDRFRIDSLTPRFVRPVDVQTSADGISWQTVTSQRVRRMGPGRGQLSVDFDETQAVYWRVVIRNGDNAPLSDVRIEAFGAPRRIDFDASPGMTYRVIYGNPSAPPPSFDYAQTHSAKALVGATDVALGPPVRNPGFARARKPWSERNPWILWIALIVSVGAIAGIAVRTMANPK